MYIRIAYKTLERLFFLVAYGHHFFIYLVLFYQ